MMSLKRLMRIVMVSVVLTGLLVTAADWPTFRGNPQNTGVAKGEPVSNQLVPLWSFEAEKDIESTAAIVDGAVYVGSLDGHLYCLNFEDGSLKWKYRASDEIKSSPVVRGDRVYFGDERGALHALDKNTGLMVWKYATEGAVISTPNFYQGVIVFGSYDSSLYGLKESDGSLLWRKETDGYVHGTAALYGDSILVAGCDGMLRQIRVTDGSEVFNTLLGSNVASSVLVHEKVAYLGTFDNQVVAVDLEAQKTLWTYEHPERKFAYYASPTMTEELIIIGGRDKMLHGIERSTGKSKWTFRVRGKVDSSPVVSGEHVIFGDTTGRIFLLRHIDGKEVWRFDMGAAAVASPAIADGKVVWGFSNGQIVCFGKKG